MPKQYAHEFRRKVVERLPNGETVKSLVVELHVSKHTLYTWRLPARVDAGRRPGARSGGGERSSQRAGGSRTFTTRSGVTARSTI